MEIILSDRTKNYERREIPINGMLYETLSGMVRNLKTDYLFYDPRTLKPLDRLDKSWHTALKKAKIVDFHFHDLRHTFASWLVMKGADLAAAETSGTQEHNHDNAVCAFIEKAHTKSAVGLLDKSVHSLFIVDENKKISEL